jgi:hypothetical protein
MNLDQDPYSFRLHHASSPFGWESADSSWVTCDEIYRGREGQAHVRPNSDRFDIGEFESYPVGDDQNAPAAALNREEVLRARQLLARVESAEFHDSDPLQADARFYRNVLGTYWRWYHKHGKPWPMAYEPAEVETAGMSYARMIYDAHGESGADALPTTLIAFCRLALPQGERKGEEYKRVEARLIDEGFYVRGDRGTTSQRIEEAYRRIVDFVDRNVFPPGVDRPERG